MSTMQYRVECVDGSTGTTTYRVFNATSAADAADQATRLGFVVGHVAADPPAAAFKRAPRRWVWFVLGMGFGSAVSLGAGFVLVYLLADAASRTATSQVDRAIEAALADAASRTATSQVDRAIEAATGVPVSESESWARVWPTLAFPEKTPPSRDRPWVDVEYDEFDDYTSTALVLKLDGAELRLSDVQHGKNSVRTAPPLTVEVSIYHPDKSVGDDLALLADGVRVTPRPHGAGWEWAYFTLRTTDLLRLTAAASVRGRADYETFELSQDDLASVRDFASRLKP